MKPVSTPLAVGLTTLLVLAFCSSAQAARNEDAFRKGMKALADKKYDEAISQFQKAIESDSTESTDKVSGILGSLFRRGDQYLPHLRLGEALLAKGDCAGALGAWEESDRQGVARKADKDVTATIGNGYARCAGQGYLLRDPLQSEREKTRQAIEAANQAEHNLSSLLTENPNVKADAAPAQGKLSEARARFDRAQKSRRAKDFEDARVFATDALTLFRDARKKADDAVNNDAEIGRRIDVLRRALDAARNASAGLESLINSSPVELELPDSFKEDRNRASRSTDIAQGALSRSRDSRELDSAIQTANGATIAFSTLSGRLRPLVEDAITSALDQLREVGQKRFSEVTAASAQLEPKVRQDAAPPEIQREFDRLSRELEQARKEFERSLKARDLAGTRKAAAAPQALTIRIHNLMERLGINQPVGPPPKALRDAVAALFGARYQDALDLLPPQPAAEIQPVFLPLFHVVRAAALYAQYAYTGSRNDGLLESAKSAAREVAKLNPAFPLDNRVFSTRFVKFFQDATGSRADGQ